MAIATKPNSFQPTPDLVESRAASLNLVLDEDLRPLPVSNRPPELHRLSSYWSIVVFVPKSSVRDRTTPPMPPGAEPAISLVPAAVNTDSRDLVPPLFNPPHRSATLAFGEVTVSLAAMEVRRKGELVALAMKEFKTLVFMIENAGRVISREELLNIVWGYECYPSTRTVDNHIRKLRQKLETEPSRPQHFLTVHSVGYKFLP